MRVSAAAAFLALSTACGPGDAPPAPDGGAGPGAPDGVRFLTRRQRELQEKPEWVLAEDVDGDGRAELVAATLSPGELRGWRGAPGGPGAELFRVAIGAYPLRPILLAPDAQGRRTLVVASRARRELAWLDPLAAEPARAALALPSVPRALAAGDLGGDGARELVLVCDQRLLAWVPERGGALATTALADELPRCVHVIGDGRGVVVGFQSTRRLALHPSVDGALGAAARTVELGGIPRAFAEGDLDGDGDPELAVAGGDEHLWVFGWGTGGGADGWFDDPPLVWTTASIPLDVKIADGDGDGRAEVYVLHAGDLSVSVLGELGRAGPGARDSGYSGQTPRSMALADLDGDGLLDVALANRDSVAVSVLYGRGGGALQRDRHAPVGGFPNGLAVLDLDADGRLDVLSLNSKDDTLTTLLARGGALAPQRRIPVGPAPRGARALDLDGDGRQDLVLLCVDLAGGRLVRLFGDGAGGLARRSAAPDLALGPTPRDVLPHDVDGDGTPELLVVDDERDELLVVAGDPAGALAVTARAALPSRPGALEELEFDGDPRPEVAVALGGSGRRGVVVGEFDGGVWRELRLIPAAGAPFDLALADLDGDGVLDLACLALADPQSKQGRVQGLFFDGAGSVALSAPRPTSLAPRHVVAADLDRDGSAEVLVAAQYAHIVNLYRVQARELAREDDVGMGIGPMALALLDVDGDGWLDLVAANGHADDVSLARIVPR
jgi:hypothetical protein